MPCAALVAALLTGIHILALREGDGWTSPLLIGDHLFDLLLALAVLWYALALGRRVGGPLLGLAHDSLSEGLAALGLGLGALSLLLFAGGALHLYYAPVFAGAWIAGTLWLRAELAASLGAALTWSVGWLRRGVPTAPTRGQRLVLLIVLVQVALLLPWATLPISNNAGTTDFDALAYHLAGPKIFLAAHGFVPRPDIPLMNAPLGGELLFIPGLLVNAQTMPRMLDLLLTLLLCMAVFALGRRQFGTVGAWLGTLIFAATPWLAPMATMAQPDLAAAFLLVLGVSDLLGWTQHDLPDAARASGPLPVGVRMEGTMPAAAGCGTISFPGMAPPAGDAMEDCGRMEGTPTAVLHGAVAAAPPRRMESGFRPPAPQCPDAAMTSQCQAHFRQVGGPGQRDRLLARAGLLIGMAVSFKLTNLPALPAVGATVGLIGLLAKGGSLRERSLRAVRGGVIVGIAMLAPLAPWLLKSLYLFGNPLYPAGLSVNDSGAHAMATLAGVGAHPSPLYHAWWIVTTLATTYWRYVSPLSPLLLLAPLALRRQGGAAMMLLLAALGVCSILFVPLYLPPRYWLGLSAVSDAAIAAVLMALAARLLAGWGYLVLCLAALLDMGLWLNAAPNAPTSSFWLGMVAVVGLFIMGILAGPLRQRARAGWLELPIVAGLSISLLLGIFVMAREMEGGSQIAVAAGTLSRRAYLTENNWYYPAFAWVGSHTPPDTTVVLVNLTTGYYLDRPYLDDWYGARLARLARGGAAMRAEVASWCRAGARLAIFDHGAAPLESYAWTHLPGLRVRALFGANNVAVLAVRPCAAHV